MAHPEQRTFMTYVKEKFPEKFINCRVLDIGSLDINGNNRYLFTDYKYIGVDIGAGNNVDVVCRGHEFKDLKDLILLYQLNALNMMSSGRIQLKTVSI